MCCRVRETLSDQLTAARLRWRGYMQDMGNTAGRETCRAGNPAFSGVPVDPTVGGPDQTEMPTAEDQYRARHNPFVYFHSSLDAAGSSPSPCAANVVPSPRLATDLAERERRQLELHHAQPLRRRARRPVEPGAEGANPGAGGLTSATRSSRRSCR